VREGFGPLRLLVIQPTSLCNLDCSYCYLPDRRRRLELPLSLLDPIFDRILESPFASEPFSLLWHAGEPLLRPPAFYDEAGRLLRAALLRHGRPEDFISQAVQTNGTVIDDRWAACLQRNRIEVGVSLDGPAWLHDRHRCTPAGRASHAATMRGIACLQRHRIPLSVIAVLTRSSLGDPDAFYDFFQRHGLRDLGLNMEETEGVHTRSSLEVPSRGEGRPDTDPEQLFRAFMTRLWQRNATAEQPLRIREFDDVTSVIACGSRIGHSDLNRPFAIVSVDHRGHFSTFDPELLSVETCYGRFNLGHVNEMPLADSVATPQFQTIWRDVQNGIRRCRSECDYFGLCGGGAGSNKYWEHGTLAAGETQACRYRIKLTADVVMQELESAMGLR
jgi:uncharacterized protein